MNAPLRLVIFDVDGTLVDSQNDIVAAMTAAFEGIGAPVPTHTQILGIVGLSLDVAMARLAPALAASDHVAMVDGYKAAYMGMRAQTGAAQSSPMYAGAMDTLQQLDRTEGILLGIATGKSKRGLDKLIEAHDLQRMFVTRQVADFHPSKPDPSMILQAMADAGTAPENTFMVGDTSFDMEMAANAGVRGIGVTWGYHPRPSLIKAWNIIDNFDALMPLLSLGSVQA